uniref:Uncharacterized protein n=1 Tax=Anguilla anguilla TaxID=7936 RepID=A0A0E9QM42_ANGAN
MPFRGALFKSVTSPACFATQRCTVPQHISLYRRANVLNVCTLTLEVPAGFRGDYQSRL